ncbi:unnamed protein product [Didymodactylos carnosus]|uniref:Uncharacterized protein n=1 Tax=Didymodactylos carnosus TaxID=1234261 RepID=A0A813QTR0_9BILA|nr:unnamed protein product [Didymodactylos carnosus]CAF0837126.1 unnamed protein product [Didymodactylos carnosus]CAF3554495.1 unnamed protein product [Didymodactylos carnosus]CAF3621965.1 unnamed protein product [Didymodactylos carnosus]
MQLQNARLVTVQAEALMFAHLNCCETFLFYLHKRVQLLTCYYQNNIIMVFEHLAVYVLNKYLGDYIENLDSKKLKIDLWDDDVVLKNLNLKSNAFTMNSEWEQMVSKEEAPVIYKEKLEGDIVKNEQTASSDHMTYILRPLNIQARSKIAKTPHEQGYVRSVFDAKIDLEQISINLNRNQFYTSIKFLPNMCSIPKHKSNDAEFYGEFSSIIETPTQPAPSQIIIFYPKTGVQIST